MVTFKFLILLLVVFGFFEVSCRRPPRQVSNYDDPVDLLPTEMEPDLAAAQDEYADQGNPATDASSSPPPTTTTTTTTTVAATEPGPASTNLLTELPAILPTSDTPMGKTNYTLYKKKHVSLVGFSILSMSGFSFSANFILLMLLLTNKMCVSKKRIPALQSSVPKPIS